MSVESKIQKVIDAKEGNRELAIFFFPAIEGEGGEDSWSVEIGNDCKWVRLGEADGEVVGRGRSLHEALDKLILEVKRRGR